MRDPYLYEDVPVLKNKLNIKDNDLLDKAEADITTSKLLEIDKNVKIKASQSYFQHLKDIHKYIFEDIYDWAGETRTINIKKPESVLNGLSVSYSDHNLIKRDFNKAIDRLENTNWKKLSLDEMASEFSKGIAEIWKVHLFREGNTRSTMKFAAHYAKSKGFPLKEDIFKNYSKYTRQSLVMASIGEYAEPQYLQKIIKDAITQGLNEQTNKRIDSINKKNVDVLNKENIKNYDIEL